MARGLGCERQLHLVLAAGWAAVCLGWAGDTMPMPEKCAGVPMAHWVSPSWNARGYHVLCFEGGECEAGSSDEDGSCNAAGLVTVACWNGKQENCAALSGITEVPKSMFDLEKQVIVAAQRQENPTRYKRIKDIKDKKSSFSGLYQFFKVNPEDGTASLVKGPKDLSGSLVLAFEGGSFVWPGIEVGFQRNITIRPTKKGEEPLALELKTRSLMPLVLEVSSFLTESECQHIIGKASPHIKKSAVSHMDHDVGKPDANWRSSSTYFMQSDDDTLKRLDSRVASLIHAPVTHQEFSQVLRYGHNERYAAHHDYFDPNMYAKNEQIQGMTKKGLFNRLATVFFYLSTVEEGGQTNFPRAGGGAQPRDFEDCSRGISVEPVEGRIMIFYSQDPAANLDEYSLHGGCAVQQGVKWSANKWIWNKPMTFIRG